MADYPNSSNQSPSSSSGHDQGASESAGGPGRPPVDAPSSTPPPPPPGYTPPPPPAQAPAAAPRGGVLHRLAVSLVTTVLLLSLGLNVYFGIALYGQFSGGPREDVYREGDASNRLVILPIEGIITAKTAEQVRKSIQHLDKNPPKALIIRVESGGGGVTASDQIWHQITRFRKAHDDVPVVASYGGAAASGGYYVSVLSDWIVAQRTTTTGSIGVMALQPTVEKLMDKLGVKWVTLEADGSPFKERANNPFKTWDQADFKVVKGLLNHAYDNFFDVVVSGRANALNIPEDKAKAKLAPYVKGQVYTAKEAKDHGLIDEVGYLSDAFVKAKALAGIDKEITPQVTTVHAPGPLSLLGLITGQSRTPQPEASLPTNPDAARAWLGEMTQMRLQYRMKLH